MVLTSLLAFAKPYTKCDNNSNYRVFQLDMTHFEVQNDQLKLTSDFKKGSSTFRMFGHLSFINQLSKSDIGWPQLPPIKNISKNVDF